MVIDELNRDLAPSRGQRFHLWRWETDAHPGIHLEGPQGLIDETMKIEDADVVIGIFWQRFGTPTGDSLSGTEHEMRRAWNAWRERGRFRIMVYFSERKSRPTSAAEARQLQELLSFRETMPNEQFWWTYEKPVHFERAVRLHLINVALSNGDARDTILLREQASAGSAPATEGQVVSPRDLALEMYDDGRRLPNVVIPRHSTLPAEWRGDFETVADNQKPLSVTVLEGLSIRGAGEAAEMDDFGRVGVLEVMLPPGLPAHHRVRFVIRLSRNGVISAGAQPGEIPIRLSPSSLS
jgi:hypothetical protein